MTLDGTDLPENDGRVFRCGLLAPVSSSQLPARPGDVFISLPALETADLSGLQALVARVAAEDAPRKVAQLRKLTGAGLYLCALVEGGCTAEELSAVIDAGADDACSAALPDAASVMLSRARRSVSVRHRLTRELESLRVLHAETQAALDNLPSPIFFKDRAGIYRGCNKAFEEFLGKPASEIIGASVFEIASPEYAQVYYDADEALMRAGGVQIYEAKVCYADGRPRDVSFHKAATRDPVTGAVNGLAGAMLDITVRRELENQLKVAAERDPLTGAFNRRKFFEVAAAEEAEAASNGVPLSILAIDVDQFKQINDRFGHACGDAALCHMVGVCQSVLGDEHVFARSGGEEFFALLKNCGLQKAAGIAEVLRQTLASSRFCFGGQSLCVEVSVGVAEFRPGETLSGTILRADRALYGAKTAGRNRIVLAPATAKPLSENDAIAPFAIRG